MDGVDLEVFESELRVVDFASARRVGDLMSGGGGANTAGGGGFHGFIGGVGITRLSLSSSGASPKMSL